MTCYNQYSIIRRILLFLLLNTLLSVPASFQFPRRREKTLSLREALAMSVWAACAGRSPRCWHEPEASGCWRGQSLKRSLQPLGQLQWPGEPRGDLVGVLTSGCCSKTSLPLCTKHPALPRWAGGRVSRREQSFTLGNPNFARLLQYRHRQQIPGSPLSCGASTCLVPVGSWLLSEKWVSISIAEESNNLGVGMWHKLHCKLK